MATNTTNNQLKDRIRVVNQGLIGPKIRTNNPSNFHPMIRNDWGITDRIRGMLGRYFAVYNGTKGDTFYNVASVLNSGPDSNTGAFDISDQQRLSTQIVGGNNRTNIPFTFAIPDNRLVLTYSPAGWKSANYQLPPLTTDVFEAADWLEVAPEYGIPQRRLNGYIDPVAAAQQHVSTGLQSNVLGINGLLFGLMEQPILDHTMLLYLPSSNATIRAASADLLSVEPTYLRYIQSVPAYESIIDASAVPEYILPNSYYLQLELENTSLNLSRLNYRYANALNLGGNVGWIAETQGGATENTTQRYYDQYATGLNSVLQNGTLDLVATKLSTMSKDLVVLNNNLSVLDTGPGAGLPLFSPFYNTITLVPENPAGYQAEYTVLQDIAAISTDYINILQTKAIEAYYDEDTSATFVTALKKIASAVDPEDYANNVYVSSHRILLDLEDLDTELFTESGPLLEVINVVNNDLPIGLATRLTDVRPAPLGVSTSTAGGNSLYYSHGQDSPVSEVTRQFGEILDNISCHVETLMYVIKKFRGEETTPVQTYFISNRFDGTDGVLTYYDSQIKSDQVYRYQIEKMILVFGNEYSYDSTVGAVYDTPLPPLPGPGETQLGDIGLPLPPLSKIILFNNSADVKVLLVPHVIGDIQVITVDSPPVSPDLSFYPLRGSNSEVKILMNASTGVREETPIAIREQDKQYYVDEYLSQTGEQITFEELRLIPNALTFRSDDPVDAYQLFRIDTKPTSYEDFQNGMLIVNPTAGIPGDLLDNLIPNRTYYYCARAVDIRGNVSNPTHIFEIEIVDNGGQIFLRQDIFMFEQVQETFSKSGRRFIYIEPSAQQVDFEQSLDNNGTLVPNVGIPNVNVEPNPTILGGDLEAKVWNNTYKIRVTSTKTGRKLDLNVTFKNSGIVNPSE